MDLFDFLAGRAARLSKDFPARFGGPEGWKARRTERYARYLEILGLERARQQAPLNPDIRGALKRDGYSVEKLVYQSMPGLYVRCNLYVPDGAKRAPAAIYVCGHSKTGKVHYQSWGPGFARRGFVCLVIDTIEQNDGKGDHHGTYGGKRLDWIAMGYSPAGVEALNAIRGIDYLCTREEVDPARIGITGISGGGSVSWWTAAADERIKVAAPACGTGDILLHIRDYTLDTHCDCMFHHNIHQMSFEEIYSLVAPRPVLMACQARDVHYFPWSYKRVFESMRAIWRIYGAEDKLVLAEDDGPHSYGAKLTADIYDWFVKHLGGLKMTTPPPPLKEETKEDLSCFSGKLPADDISGKVQDLFIVQERPQLPKNPGEWEQTRLGLISWLRETAFQAWPDNPPPIEPVRTARILEGSGEEVDRYSFTSEKDVPIEIEFRQPLKWLDNPDLPVILLPAEIRENGEGRSAFPWAPANAAVCFVEARTLGRWAYLTSARIFMERAGALTGYTPDSMALWDLLRAAACLRELPAAKARPIWIYGAGKAAGLAVYAAALDESVAGAILENPPAGHAVGGPLFLGVLRKLDLPQAAGLIAPRPILAAGRLPESYSWTRDLYSRHAAPFKVLANRESVLDFLARPA